MSDIEKSRPAFSIGDLAGLSGPVQTLIEKIADAISAIYRSKRIVTTAKDKAEAKEIEAFADLRIGAIQKLKSDQILTALAETKADNLGSIITYAAENITAGEAESAPDPDWILDFLDLAQNVSTEDMQELWALLLSGELKQPGSFTRRTLQTVKMLSVEEAREFQIFCRYPWHIEASDGFELTGAIIPQGEEAGVTEADFPELDVNDIGHLEYIGLVEMHSTLEQETSDPFTISYFGQSYRAVPPRDTSFVFDTVTFTEAGKSIAQALSPVPDERYLIETIAYLEERGFDIEKVN